MAPERLYIPDARDTKTTPNGYGQEGVDAAESRRGAQISRFWCRRFTMIAPEGR